MDYKFPLLWDKGSEFLELLGFFRENVSSCFQHRKIQEIWTCKSVVEVRSYGYDEIELTSAKKNVSTGP